MGYPTKVKVIRRFPLSLFTLSAIPGKPLLLPQKGIKLVKTRLRKPIYSVKLGIVIHAFRISLF